MEPTNTPTSSAAAPNDPLIAALEKHAAATARLATAADWLTANIDGLAALITKLARAMPPPEAGDWWKRG